MALNVPMFAPYPSWPDLFRPSTPCLLRSVEDVDARDKPGHDGIDHAGAAAIRSIGFSTIGRLISAESTPNRIASHHTTLYEPVRSNAMPPSQTPRKPPTWWLKKAKPARVASHLVPNISAMMPLVGGTVESHIKPMVAPKTRHVTGVTGNEMNARIAAARVK